MRWRHYDKLVYSVIWLVALLYAMGIVIKHDGTLWDVTYGVLFVAILIQLALIIYNTSDAWQAAVRRRKYGRMKG